MHVQLPGSWIVILMNKNSLIMCKCIYFHTVMYVIENAVVYMKSTLFTNSYVQKYHSLEFIVRIVVVYMYITLFTNILTLECMLGHQSLCVYVCVKFQIPIHYIVRDTWRSTFFN